ncbi:hypothetical protein [Methylomonas sp. MgM2]
MKTIFRLRYSMPVLLACITFIATPITAKENSTEGNSKPGYSVDGRTSASVLAAKRSHEVAKEDEIGLSVFSGLFVIAVIGFFAKQYFEKR